MWVSYSLDTPRTIALAAPIGARCLGSSGYKGAYIDSSQLVATTCITGVAALSIQLEGNGRVRPSEGLLRLE